MTVVGRSNPSRKRPAGLADAGCLSGATILSRARPWQAGILLIFPLPSEEGGGGRRCKFWLPVRVEASGPPAAVRNASSAIEESASTAMTQTAETAPQSAPRSTP